MSRPEQPRRACPSRSRDRLDERDGRTMNGTAYAWAGVRAIILRLLGVRFRIVRASVCYMALLSHSRGNCHRSLRRSHRCRVARAGYGEGHRNDSCKDNAEKHSEIRFRRRCELIRTVHSRKENLAAARATAPRCDTGSTIVQWHGPGRVCARGPAKAGHRTVDSPNTRSHQDGMRLLAVVLHALIVAGLVLSNPATVGAISGMSGTPDGAVMALAGMDEGRASPCPGGHCPDGGAAQPDCRASLGSCGGLTMLGVTPFVLVFAAESTSIPFAPATDVTVVPPRHDPPPPRTSAILV